MSSRGASCNFHMFLLKLMTAFCSIWVDVEQHAPPMDKKLIIMMMNIEIQIPGRYTKDCVWGGGRLHRLSWNVELVVL